MCGGQGREGSHVCASFIWVFLVGWSSTAVPNFFVTRDRFRGKQFFQGPGWGDGFRMIKANSIYRALYFYYYYISSTSDHQALDPGGWGPLQSGRVLCMCICVWADDFISKKLRSFNLYISGDFMFFFVCVC